MIDTVTVNGLQYKLSYHASCRAKNREISLQDITEAIKNPKVNFRKLMDGNSEGFFIIGKNDVKLILSKEKNFIITLMKLNKEYYGAKTKNKKNDKKRKLRLKKRYGNRVRNL